MQKRFHPEGAPWDVRWLRYQGLAVNHCSFVPECLAYEHLRGVKYSG